MKAQAKRAARSFAFTVMGSRVTLARRLRMIERMGALTVLNFHRVDDGGSSAYAAISPRLFDDLIAWLVPRYRIVTFADLGGLKTDARPPLILSFDDGYRDFIETVMPILHKHGVRANQNVIPGSVASGRPPINVLVQDFIGQAPASILKELPAHLDTSVNVDPGDRIATGLRVSAAIKNRPIEEQRAILARIAPLIERLDRFQMTAVMTLAEVREAATTHEIGAHSMDHATMAAETDDYLLSDAVACRQWLSDTLDVRDGVYAFPNGAIRKGQAEIVRRAGFSHVLLVGEAFSKPGLTCHSRFTMHGNTEAELKCRATGMFQTRSPRASQTVFQEA